MATLPDMIRDAIAPGHLLVVLLVILLVFGGRKLPELARGMGQGLRIFKAELRAAGDDDARERGAADDR